MTEPRTDTLQKPDMQAVLARTHVTQNLHDFLIPTFEAISNAVHSIEAAYAERAIITGRVEISFVDAKDPAKLLISVTDNGVGLNDPNYASFKTPFSGYKLIKRGRGFGRFMSFKIFDRIHYSSRYAFFDQKMSRCFRFDIKREDEIIIFDGEPDFGHEGLKVEFSNPLTQWHDIVRNLDAAIIGDEIGSHFLPQFLEGRLPPITIQFENNEPYDLSSHFKGHFVSADTGDMIVEIDGQEVSLQYSIARVPKGKKFKSHCLLLSAADRIVGHPRDLKNKIGDEHFVDDAGNKYVVIAIVKGEPLEARLNDSRSSISISSKDVENIVNAICEVIQKVEASQITKIKNEQGKELQGALAENPILKLGLRGKKIDEYVAGKPNSWRKEQFISDLAIERYRETSDLNKAIASAGADPVRYAETLKNIVGRLDNSKKEALAEYVIHRKQIITLVEDARKFQDNGSKSPEDVIHDLIFRRFSDSVEKSYFDHNLWLIDDLLSFMPYASSDRTLHGGRRKAGDKIPDLVLFEDSLLLGDDSSHTLAIVEFKKPGRDDYTFGPPKSDPVIQVLETLEKATVAGGITRTDGTDVSFVGTSRKFAFIIADLKTSLVKVLQRHDFQSDYNPKIYTRYKGHEKIMIQAFGYDTLIENAKKRNQAFFTVLFGD
jgi:anti-sigma regulatory factor (Ser/Thr protein kinase)